jgi:SprT protein
MLPMVGEAVNKRFMAICKHRYHRRWSFFAGSSVFGNHVILRWPKSPTPDTLKTVTPMLSADQRAQILTHRVGCIHSLSEQLRYQFEVPQIGFNLRGMSAGVFDVRGSKCRIRYNPTLLAANFDAGVRQTVPHEVAHYAVYCMFGREARPHGAEWRSMMAALGVEPRVHHEFDLSSVAVRRQRRFRYACACNSYEVSTTRHNRIQLTRASYLCRSCGQTLSRQQLPG